jgi:hypothetical protein
MIILKEQNTSQSFKIIPRYYSGVNLRLVNESSGQVLQYNVSPEQISYYHQITFISDTTEGNFYALTLFDGDGNVVYKDKVFCTNQEITDYSINKDEYVEKSSDNEFIIYE